MASSSPDTVHPSSELDWKSRYTDLVNEFDTLEQTHQSDSQTWKKTISRLSAALQDYSHADSNLIQGLNIALKGTPSATIVATAVNDFCLRLPELATIAQTDSNGPSSDRQQHSESDTTSISDRPITGGQPSPGYDPEEFDRVFGQICTQLPLDQDITRVLLHGGHKLQSPTARLRSLCEELQSCGDQFFDQPLDPAITGLLGRLVDNLPKFPATATPVQLLCGRLEKCVVFAELIPILEEIPPLADQIHKAIEQERQQSASFLNVIWQRLAELNGYFESTSTDRKQTSLANKELKQGIEEKVSLLVTEANTAESLPALQQLLAGSVEQIHHQVNNHVEQELPRLARAEEQCQQLANQVTDLQRETNNLKQVLEEKQLEANRDPLTNLANRRAFDKLLTREYSRWRRYHRPLSLIFLDIDWFKRINDEYGHQAGDAALISVSRILRKSLRDHDLLARYGGEEFVALLPDATQKAAFEVAEKLRVAVMETHFHFQNQPVQVTISCGVGSFSDQDNPDAVLSRADAALYAAKNGGRNQTVAAPG